MFNLEPSLGGTWWGSGKALHAGVQSNCECRNLALCPQEMFCVQSQQVEGDFHLHTLTFNSTEVNRFFSGGTVSLRVAIFRVNKHAEKCARRPTINGEAWWSSTYNIVT